MFRKTVTNVCGKSGFIRDISHESHGKDIHEELADIVESSPHVQRVIRCNKNGVDSIVLKGSSTQHDLGNDMSLTIRALLTITGKRYDSLFN